MNRILGLNSTSSLPTSLTEQLDQFTLEVFSDELTFGDLVDLLLFNIIANIDACQLEFDAFDPIPPPTISPASMSWKLLSQFKGTRDERIFAYLLSCIGRIRSEHNNNVKLTGTGRFVWCRRFSGSSHSRSSAWIVCANEFWIKYAFSYKVLSHQRPTSNAVLTNAILVAFSALTGILLAQYIVCQQISHDFLESLLTYTVEKQTTPAVSAISNA